MENINMTKNTTIHDNMNRTFVMQVKHLWIKHDQG